MYKLFLVWNNIQTPFPLEFVSGMAVKKGMIALIACGMYTSTLLMEWVVRSIHWQTAALCFAGIRAFIFHSNESQTLLLFLIHPLKEYL